MATAPRFLFRGVHPQVAIGTASDRYAGWLGQVYTPERYAGRIARRPHVVGGRRYVEEVLPVDCVEEYFEHFGALELDYTFYRLLLDEHLHPTENFHVLRNYAAHLKEGDRLLLKAPQAIIAPRLRRGGAFAANPDYLDPEIFTHRFYAPAVKLLGPHLAGIVFEQEYRRAVERDTVEDEAVDLDRFFRRIPDDRRYHLELRTASYLAPPIFAVLERNGVGHVLSHWTWLPQLREQLEKAGDRFFNAAGEVVIRLLTPHGMRYENAYAKAFPFDQLVDGMASERMFDETVEIMRLAIERGLHVTVVVNNRAGGNAPLLAEQIVERFRRGKKQGSEE